jgi:circadian clock protein KaiC
MLMRLLDFLKTQQITAFFTSLTDGRFKELEQTDVGISSLIDTWIFSRDVELNGERNRCIYVLKSRGMANSNQVREFVLSKNGIRLLPVYMGGGRVLTGSARLAQEAREKAEHLIARQVREDEQRALKGKRKALEAQIVALQSQLEQEQMRIDVMREHEEEREETIARGLVEMRSLRRVEEGDGGMGRKPNGKGGA